ncbi:hypothetical protein H7X65_01365 [Candidatus Parcubacteria bacterium]|nr:hypothetical protein [Candidatus Parcubacteria bacterium]
MKTIHHLTDNFFTPFFFLATTIFLINFGFMLAKGIISDPVNFHGKVRVNFEPLPSKFTPHDFAVTQR